YILQQFWAPLAHLTAHTLAYSLELCGVNVLKVHVNHAMSLWTPHFSAIMVMGCSGLEGIFYFFFSYFLMGFLGEHPRWKLHPLLICGLGVMWMFALNTLRVLVFFLVAIQIETQVASGRGRKFYEWAFHENIGWVLYLA